MKNIWTYEEHILAFNLYCKIPFSKINANYPPVKELAKIINRSNSSVAMKLANFARLNPALKARNISGLTQGAKGEKIIWEKFNNDWEQLSYESECILAKYKNKSIEYELYDIPLYLEGREREIIVRQRVNQSFFRKMILASYNNKCCVTGSNYVSLLSACHIKPWNKDVKNRMNPQNGLCMNILLHYSFDQGLFTITNDYRILLSREVYSLNDPFMSKNLLSYENCKITLPQKFIPEKVFLEYHYDTIFKK